MRKLMLLAVVLILLCTGMAWAETKAPDELQLQYASKMCNIARDIEVRGIRIEYAGKKAEISRNFLLKYPHDRDNQKTLKEAEEEGTTAEKEREKFYRDKDDLKTDALKYYQGKLPQWLSEKWKADKFKEGCRDVFKETNP
ncbi:MAG: hypothetical protein ACHQ0Y_14585 [Thermodesulfovibrionales bacterium]